MAKGWEAVKEHLDATGTKFCSICQMEYTGIGNNAEPINSGRCCDRCDAFMVIPARLQIAMREYRLKMKKGE